jgi:hypothetical protein
MPNSVLHLKVAIIAACTSGGLKDNTHSDHSIFYNCPFKSCISHYLPSAYSPGSEGCEMQDLNGSFLLFLNAKSESNPGLGHPDLTIFELQSRNAQ